MTMERLSRMDRRCITFAVAALPGKSLSATVPTQGFILPPRNPLSSIMDPDTPFKGPACRIPDLSCSNSVHFFIMKIYRFDAPVLFLFFPIFETTEYLASFPRLAMTPDV
jgi:hypothetical protein